MRRLNRIAATTAITLAITSALGGRAPASAAEAPQGVRAPTTLAQNPTGSPAPRNGSPPPAAPEGTGAVPPVPPAGAISQAVSRIRPSGPRTAIMDFVIEGEGAAPALAMQLQDGFVLGLLRAGIDVIDSADVAKRLSGSPELEGCESSPCLKRAGELLDARYALRVRVGLTGNSYKMTARLFSTEGAAPAALPLATLSRTCDVCTVGEARDAMIKLADGMRARIEAEAASKAPPVGADVGARPRLGPLAALATGVAVVALGAALISAAGSGDKAQIALGGTLVGAGVTTSAVALFLTLRSADPGAGPKTALLGAAWTF